MRKANRIVIVGGSYGIGLAVAKRLADAGDELIVVSRSAARLTQARELLGDRTVTRQLDASDESAVVRLFEEIGPFDHLIATIKPALPHSAFVHSDTRQVRDAYEAKFWGQYYLARHSAQYLRPGGSMILTSGIASQRGYPGFSIVAAMNGAIESLVRSLAVELAPLRVNAVCPGFIMGEVHDPERERKVRAMSPLLPLDRLGRPSEVADAYEYLLNCSYATGSVVTVDGGVICS